MNAEQKELFRKAILRVLDTNRTRFGLGILPISHHLGSFGFTLTSFNGDAKALRDALADELEYLSGKGLIEEALKFISKENRAWRITDQGIAFVDANC